MEKSSNSSTQRIVWIDWAKAFGIMIVVFCHVPQFDTFEKAFLYSFQMPFFFFIAGLLHKQIYDINSRFKKYFTTLIIPYILFQFIGYPYWLIQKVIDCGFDWTNYTDSIILPFFKCFIGYPINGITWFVYSLLIMKMITDFAIRLFHPKLSITILIIIDLLVAFVFQDDYSLKNIFTINSTVRFMTFFLIGQLIRNSSFKEKFLDTHPLKLNIPISIITFTIGALCVASNKQTAWDRYCAFYIAGWFGLYTLISICKCIKHCPSFITTISKGTIIILGMHWMFIGTLNYLLENIKGIHDIKYSTPETVLIVILITFANYFIIRFCQKHFKIILGGR